MSKLDRELALRSAALSQQRRNLRQRRQVLHQDVMALCKRPTTLACAALAGFVLARLNPLALAGRRPSPAAASGKSIAGGVVSTLQVVLVSLAPTLLKRAFTASLSARERSHRGDDWFADREAPSQVSARPSQ